ncbi:MAG: flagellar protein FlgN [Synergistaceae bacterium]|nr:flagellar protein FlgN [Synergistaceae bacterium]
MSVQALTQAMLDEADLIDELLELVIEQREAVKADDRELMQDLMKDIQDVFFSVQTQEAQRARLARFLAANLDCEPRLSSLAAAVPDEERALFKGAGDRLGYVVFALKSEMAILNSLIERNERFSAMLLSEWRRLDAGFTRAGGLDFRG